MQSRNTTPKVAIACGGTGGHLFPGLAVGRCLLQRGCAVTLLISPKEVDQLAAKSAGEMEILTLPSVGLAARRGWQFLRGGWRSYRLAQKHFRQHTPQAVLAMGGFTSAPPVLAARRFGAATFLHESNTIPGRANLWLSRMVDQAFVGFPGAANRLRARNVVTTGTPVRAQFRPLDAAACRTTLGLNPQLPVLLVMGGSQGARAINDLLLKTVPGLVERLPQLQLLHLTGSQEYEKVKNGYAPLKPGVVVRPFLAEMELALGAATLAVNRAGASSLAEMAAMRVPPVLIPLPTAADNHQFHNARAFADTGAALMLEQQRATPDELLRIIVELLETPDRHARMQAALERWHSPDAAEQIAGRLMQVITDRFGMEGRRPVAPAVVHERQFALT